MIHQYKLSGYNIVLDVYSGSVHAVDDVAYDAIALIDQGSSREQAAAALAKKYADRADVTAADISDVLDDIDELTAAGQLFAPDAYADHAFDFKNRSNVVKALCLHVAHTCNLNCSYCFAAQGKFHGEAGLMSFETGKRALDFLIENSGTRRNLEVDFFGGEPLMNFEVCKQLVAYARSIEKKYNKNFRFTMTTNGIGITDEVIDWCNKECHNVVLSLDGRKEVNDRFRVDLAGNGSYDRIVPKFQKLVKARGGQGYYMRGTFTHHNVDFTKDLFHMADDLGFTELSMEPVVAPPDSPEALTEEDLPKLFDQYELLAKDMGKTVADIKAIIASLHEFNPMMGHRGCRLAVTYPEIAEMQTNAVIKAALKVSAETGKMITPHIMIPLVGEVKELKFVKDVVVKTADALIAAAGVDMKYEVGTMIEIPRAALTAGEIAKEADFFSFGTNDLTQMTFGFSRDDAAKFLTAYYDTKIYESDPFQHLDQIGVGKLVKMAAHDGRATNPNLGLGICGEHGGDPSSVEFCHNVGLDYVSCSPYRVPIARLAAAQAAIKNPRS